MRRTGGEDQVVVVEAALVEHEATLRDVDAVDAGQDGAGVVLVADDGADRVGDVAGVEGRRRDLVQQRLEQVVVAAIDDGDAHAFLAQRARGREAGEAAADDDDVRGRRVDSGRDRLRVHV